MKTLKILCIFLLTVLVSETYAQPFVRDWASFYGPESSELINLREDRHGNLYGSFHVLGSPYDLTDYMNSFTTPGAFDTYNNDDSSSFQSLFFKLNPQGEVVWSSFFPGEIVDISLSPDGQNFYLIGNTTNNTNLIASEGAPFPDPYEFGTGTGEVLDGFLMKFDTNGQKIWGTYLPFAMKGEADEAGNLYVSGETYLSELFGTEGVFEPDFIYVYNDEGEWEPNNYLLKVNSQGQIEWSTYNGFGRILDIALKNDELYIAGFANSNSETNYFATDGAFASGLSAGAFLSKFNTEGQRLWSTYYGDDGIFDCIDKIKVASDGKVLIAGYTSSSENIASPGTFRENIAGSYDYFLARFDGEGNREWGTYYGENEAGEEYPVPNLNIMDASTDYIYVGGSTNGTEGIATEDGLNPNLSSDSTHNYDAFLNVFDHSGNRMWGTYYGGTANELSNGVMASNNGLNFFLYGGTKSRWDDGISTPNGAYPDFNLRPFGNHSNAMNGYLVKFSRGDLGFPSVENNNEIRLYPNPNNGNFTVTGSVLGKEKFQMQLFDLSGKLIINKKLGLYEQQNFDYSSYLKNGVYLLNLKSESSEISKTFKIIIQ